MGVYTIAYLKTRELIFLIVLEFRVDFSTLLAQVAKTSQGLVPPSFFISSTKMAFLGR